MGFPKVEQVYHGDIDFTVSNPLGYKKEYERLEVDIIIGNVRLDFDNSLEILSNVKVITGELDLSDCSITNFKGLGNLKRLGSIDITDCKNLKSYEGINIYLDIEGEEMYNNGKSIKGYIKQERIKQIAQTLTNKEI